MNENNQNSELSKFFSLSLNLLCVAGVDAKFKHINPQFEKLLGYSEEELMSRPFVELIHPDDREKTLAAMDELKKGNDVINFENRYICKNGKALSLRWSAAPDAEEGNIYAVGVDITEEKKEDYYKEQMNLIRSMYISDKLKSRQFWDKTLELLLDITGSEYGFIGEIKHSDEGNPFLKTFSLTNISWNEATRKLFEEKSKEGLEFHNLNTLFGEVVKTGEALITNDPKNHPKSAGIPMGHPALNAFMGVPLHYGGKYIGMVGVANRKDGYDETLYHNLRGTFQTIASIIHAFLLERDLNEAGKLNSLYKNAIDESSIVSITDPEGKIIHVNDMFCEISGYSREELIGNNHRMIKSGKMGEEFFQNLWSTIKAGNTWQGEVCNRAKDGSEYWVDSTIIPFKNSEGQIDRFISIRKDITKERQQKKLEIEYQRAKEATKAKSEFLSTMSHEIRTPLNGVIGMADILNSTDLSEEQQKIVHTILNSGNALLAIVNDILDLSKIEAGKIVFDEKECDLKSYMNDLLEPYRFACLEKNIDFNFVDNNYSDYIICDEGRIGQIITNLVSNAIKFTAEGGVSVNLKQSDIGSKKSLIDIEVMDSGVGIPESFISQIFDPFSQNIQNTGKHVQGTGLGLSITKKIIEALGGNISIQSKPGVGSQFKVSIPVTKGKKISNQDVVKSNAEIFFQDEEKKRILIAEDNPTNQFVLSCFVSKLGHHYKLVSNGAEAFSALSLEDFDAVLMDCQMPIVDGYEATKMIRQSDKKFRDIPIIALTANAIKGDDQRCFDSGMNGYLTKPLIKSDLEVELNRIFATKSALDLDRLNDLLDNQLCGDVMIFEKTIKTFLESSLRQKSELKTAFEKNNVKEVRFLAHTIKSPSKMLGAIALGECCEKIENIHDTDFSSHGALFRKFERLYKDTNRELQEYLREIES